MRRGVGSTAGLDRVDELAVLPEADCEGLTRMELLLEDVLDAGVLHELLQTTAHEAGSESAMRLIDTDEALSFLSERQTIARGCEALYDRLQLQRDDLQEGLI